MQIIHLTYRLTFSFLNAHILNLNFYTVGHNKGLFVIYTLLFPFGGSANWQTEMVQTKELFLHECLNFTLSE